MANSTGVEWPPRDIVDSVADRHGQVVLSAVNCGFVDFADNWAQSLLRIGVTNFVFVPLDEEAHAILSATYPEHVVPIVPGLEWLPRQPASFANTKAFKAVTQTRPTFLLAFIEAGYTVFYNDADTYWLTNALVEFDDLHRRLGKGDRPHAVIIDDDPKHITEDIPNFCSGIIYLRPTSQVRDFLLQWIDEIALVPGHRNDQPAFNAVIRRFNEEGVMPIRVGDWDKFPPGDEFFKGRAGYMQEEHQVAIVHNNWIVGEERKRSRFIEHGMWNPSGKLGRYSCGSK